jgi:predicted RNase H-like HicB family nuclease
MIIEQGQSGLFGSFPDLPGLTVGGDTQEEIIALAREFMRDYLADYDRKGKSWPDSTPAVALALIEIDPAEVTPEARKAEAR